MALQACPECGHDVSDRAVMCPGCGVPGREAEGQGVPVATTQVTAEDWALSRLMEGRSRRQVVAELLKSTAIAKSDADALVRRVEAAAIAELPARSSRLWPALAVTAVLLVLFFVFAVLMATPG